MKMYIIWGIKTSTQNLACSSDITALIFVTTMADWAQKLSKLKNKTKKNLKQKDCLHSHSKTRTKHKKGSNEYSLKSLISLMGSVDVELHVYLFCLDPNTKRFERMGF